MNETNQNKTAHLKPDYTMFMLILDENRFIQSTDNQRSTLIVDVNAPENENEQQRDQVAENEE